MDRSREGKSDAPYVVITLFITFPVFPATYRATYRACDTMFNDLALAVFLTAYMSGRRDSSEPSRVEDRQEDFGHPRGTLAIVIVFGALFMLAWLAMYLFVFLERGAPHS